MAVQRILVVDDEKNIARVLQAYLEKEGYEVFTSHEGTEALRLARSEEPDLIVLDLMLPGISGEEICRTLRQEGSRVPVVMLTAKSGLDEKLNGLALGADDYIVKPFSPQEVVARVKTVLRRSSVDYGPLTDVLTLAGGNLIIDIPAYRVSWQGEPLDLTPTEFKLLAYMARRPGRAFNRSQLAEVVFDFLDGGSDRTIDAHVKNLRKKLDSSGAPPLIKTVYGVGYKYEEI